MRLRMAQAAPMNSLMILGAALGCGLIAGVFWAFSNFVMPALAQLPKAQGIVAMQSINRVVLNRRFLGVLFGTAVACVAAVIGALLVSSPLRAWLCLAGCLSYLVGTILVTGICHVPRNDALARSDPDSAQAAQFWATYVAEWSTWNHVRSAASLSAAILFTLALSM